MDTTTSAFAVLLRHGHYEQPEGVPSAWLPHPLTARGREQAASAMALVQASLADAGVALAPTLYCSSLLRAFETAQIMATTLGRTPDAVVSTPALNERGLGALANLSVTAIEEIARRDPRVGPLPVGWKSSSHVKLPYDGAESLMEAGARVAAFVEARCRGVAEREGPAQATLFVGHGAAFRHAAVALGVLDLSQIPALSMHHCKPVVLERQSLGQWRHAGGGWKQRHREEGHD